MEISLVCYVVNAKCQGTRQHIDALYKYLSQRKLAQGDEYNVEILIYDEFLICG